MTDIFIIIMSPSAVDGSLLSLLNDYSYNYSVSCLVTTTNLLAVNMSIIQNVGSCEI